MAEGAPGAGRGADLVDVERFFTNPGALEELTESLLGVRSLDPDSHERTEPGDRPRPTPSAPLKSDARALIGRSFHGYEAVEHLGSGASAHVYRGQHRHLARGCAIKVLRPELSGSPTAARRLEREGRLLVEIRDPRVIEGYDVGVSPEGHPFALLELVEGRTLLDLILKEAPLSIDRVTDLTRQIALGLDALHRRGIVHRDLKASNVMVVASKDGPHVKIMDLGLMVDTQTDVTRLTVSAGLMGTPHYMAPEQAVDPRKVTGAADLYALGVIAYAMLARRLPYDGPGPQALAPGKVEGWGELGQVVARMLELEPSRRPSSAKEVAEALDPIDDVTASATVSTTSPRALPDKPAQSASTTFPIAVAPASSAEARPWSLLAWAVAGLMFLVGSASLAYSLVERPQVIEARPTRTDEVAAPVVIERPAAASIEAQPQEPPSAIEPPQERQERRPKRLAPASAPPIVVTPTPIVAPPPPPVDQREEVDARLGRLRLRLKALSTPPSERWDAWEQRYIELKKAALVAQAPSDWDELARGVLDLERELNRAIEDR